MRYFAFGAKAVLNPMAAMFLWHCWTRDGESLLRKVSSVFPKQHIFTQNQTPLPISKLISGEAKPRFRRDKTSISQISAHRSQRPIERQEARGERREARGERLNNGPTAVHGRSEISDGGEGVELEGHWSRVGVEDWVCATIWENRLTEERRVRRCGEGSDEGRRLRDAVEEGAGSAVIRTWVRVAVGEEGLHCRLKFSVAAVGC
ncbi:hypothetical protein L484_008365 [Morus notabilis]|uniref:Uncharacterized protein n=1 Tax=Morus notabilis TaxID=981085 RepID=W9RXB6_9ROSA|nr:hypothetical protein L484_008365 [Morus notabilis]